MIEDLVWRLRSADVALHVEGGRLVCDAPPGVLNGPLADEIRAHKAELIAFVEREASEVGGEAESIPVLDRANPLPLGLVQQRMWVLQKMDEATTVYNLPGAWKFTGEFQPELFQKAFGLLVHRQEVMRARFLTNGGHPTQTFDAPVPDPPLPVVDLTAEPDPDRALQERLAEERGHRFDLEGGPAWRARLYRLGPQVHVFFFMPHHIIWDGWCFDILLDDLAELYDAMRQGRPHRLPHLLVGYADYVGWHRSLMAGPEMRRQLDYWRDTLEPLPPTLALPIDRPRPTVLTDRGDRVLFRVSSEVVESLRTVGRSCRATLFMTVLAVYRVLLLQLTGQTDLAVGAPIQNRLRPEAERLFGVFVNTLVLRVECTEEMTFGEVLAAARDVCLDAFDHQDVPFESLVETLELEPTLSHTPLYQTLFTFQDITDRPRDMGAAEISQVHVDVRVAPTDLLFGFMASERGALVVLDYATDLFTEGTIVRIRDRLIQLLETVADPRSDALSRRLDTLPLLTDSDREFIDSITVTERKVESLVPEALRIRASIERARTAVSDRATTLTYAELWSRSGGVARVLVARGVTPGAIVGVCTERSADMVIALLGIWRAGGAYLPLDPEFPAERLAFMVSDSGARWIVTDGRVSLPETDAEIVTVSDVAGAEAVELSEPDADDLAYVIYTSGSTGLPKGVEVTHGNLANFIHSMARSPGLSASDVLVAVTTLSFDIAGLELWLPLTVGARVEIADEGEVRDGEWLMERLDESGATVMQATPSTWRMLLDAGWEGRLEKALCGGETFPKELVRPLLERADEVWNLYGPTETTIWSTAYRVEGEGDGSVPIGRPIDNTRVYGVDREGRLAPPGLPGELWIGGLGVTPGYHDRAELTAECFVPDPFREDGRLYRTGDLVRWRDDGQLEHLGRMDQQRKVLGHRIEPGEIEAALVAHASIRQAVATVHGSGLDARLVAFVVLAPGENLLASEVRRFLSGRLPAYMVPGTVVEVDEIPLTPNGKVDRKALPDPSADTSRTAYCPPQGEQEEAIAEVWRELLSLERVGQHDNFFELGGHSLLAIRAVARLSDEKGWRLDPRSFFFMTLEQVAASANRVADGAPAA